MGRFRLRRHDLAPAAGLLAVSLILAFLLRALLDHLSWAVLASLFLLAGSGLYLSYRHLKTAAKAANRLADALKGHGVRIDEEADSLAAANAAADLLDRYGAKTADALREVKEAQERRVEEVTQTHRELLTHHKVTKRMLKSQSAEEVFQNLLQGIRDGLGFDRTVLGVCGQDGDIVFQEAIDAPVVRISAWREDSLVARILWNGQPLLVDASEAAGLPLVSEDRLLIGEGPALLAPVIRKPSRKCAEIRRCGNVGCPAYLQENPRCWLVGSPDMERLSPVSPAEKRKRCARCEMFSAQALLVVRSRPGSRRIDPQSMGGVATIVNEAAMAFEVVDLYENLRKMSVTDGLTGLVNHREFYNLLRRELERARRYRNTVSVLIIDVDDFKQYNDRHGHLAGDIALKAIAEILVRSARGTDIVARYGGEEFAIILPESTPGGALMLAERIKSEIYRNDFMPDGRTGVHLSVSIGIYSSEAGAESEDQVVSYADEAAYSAKFSGKNRVVVKTHA